MVGADYMTKSKEEKLQQLENQIVAEENAIKKTKAKIKILKAKKNKLILKMQNEEFAELKETLADYGITTASDFEKFIQDTENVNFEKIEQTKANGY